MWQRPSHNTSRARWGGFGNRELPPVATRANVAPTRDTTDVKRAGQEVGKTRFTTHTQQERNVWGRRAANYEQKRQRLGAAFPVTARTRIEGSAVRSSNGVSGTVWQMWASSGLAEAAAKPRSGKRLGLKAYVSFFLKVGEGAARAAYNLTCYVVCYVVEGTLTLACLSSLERRNDDDERPKNKYQVGVYSRSASV